MSTLYTVRHELKSYLRFHVFKICLQLIRLPHGAVQLFVGLGVHITDDTLQPDVPGGVSVGMNLDEVPVFGGFISSAEGLVLLL